MPTPTGYSRSPKLQTGALIQLTRDIVGVVPLITLFQYNPEQIQRSFEIHSNPGSDEKGMQAPSDQPHPPDESLNFSLELDATDDLERSRQTAVRYGVADRLAVLEKLIFPVGGQASGDRSTRDQPVVRRPTVPILLLSLGRNRVFPVRITSLSVSELFHSPDMMPIHAKVDLSLHIMSDEEFRPTPGKVELDIQLAQATYRRYCAKRDQLASDHPANVVSDITVT